MLIQGWMDGGRREGKTVIKGESTRQETAGRKRKKKTHHVVKVLDLVHLPLVALHQGLSLLFPLNNLCPEVLYLLLSLLGLLDSRPHGLAFWF